MIVNVRDDQILNRYDVISYTDTKTSIFFKAGSKIKSYYILISKFDDIEFSITIPNKNNFKIIYREHNEYHIVKCLKNKTRKFQLVINSQNISKKVNE